MKQYKKLEISIAYFAEDVLTSSKDWDFDKDGTINDIVWDFR